jgi:predicted PurR-regulated permease PerM
VPDAGLDLGGGDLVPGWLRRLGALGWRILAVLAMAVVLVSIAVRLSTVTASIIFAILVAASVAPAYRYVRAGRGWAASKSAAVLCVVALGALAISVTVIVLTFAPYVGQLIDTVREGVTAISTFLTSVGVPEDAVALITGSVTDVQELIGGAVSNLVGSIADAATVVILGGFLTFYVLYDYEKAWSTAIRDLNPSQQAVVTEHGTVALDNVSAYLRGTALAAGVDALAALIYLPILGVPLAGPLAVVVFLGGFVPYIGPVVASSIVLLAVLATQGVVVATVVLGLMIAVGLLQRRVLKGAVARTMPHHPALVVIALPAGCSAIRAHRVGRRRARGHPRRSLRRAADHDPRRRTSGGVHEPCADLAGPPRAVELAWAYRRRPDRDRDHRGGSRSGRDSAARASTRTRRDPGAGRVGPRGSRARARSGGPGDDHCERHPRVRRGGIGDHRHRWIGRADTGRGGSWG